MSFCPLSPSHRSISHFYSFFSGVRASLHFFIISFFLLVVRSKCLFAVSLMCFTERLFHFSSEVRLNTVVFRSIRVPAKLAVSPSLMDSNSSSKLSPIVNLHDGTSAIAVCSSRALLISDTDCSSYCCRCRC